MENGNFANAQLRALIDVAAVAAGAFRLEEVIELAAERALAALEASSLSISRWDADAGALRTLVNVGELGPGEDRFPKDETYSVEDYPSLKRLLGGFESSLCAVDDPTSDFAHRELLKRLGKEASMSVPMVLEDKPWGELEVMTAPGHPRLSEDDVPFLRAIADQVMGAIHRAELFSQIETLAYTDALTGLASRRAVEAALEDACDSPHGPGSPALVLCDIDELKRVNDEGGHEAGDRALIRAAEALREAAAPYPDAVVGRIGGDELCVLLPAGTAETGRAVAHDAVRRLEAKGAERMSCGVAARGREVTRPAELLRAADQAQYCAKRDDRRDVAVAGEHGAGPPPEGRDRAYRAGDPDGDARLARELLGMLEEMNGASAEERLARLLARLEREA